MKLLLWFSFVLLGCGGSVVPDFPDIDANMPDVKDAAAEDAGRLVPDGVPEAAPEPPHHCPPWCRAGGPVGHRAM